MTGFTRADCNRPVGQFFLKFTLDRRQVTGNNQFTVFDLIFNSGLLDKLSDEISAEFAGGPGSQNRQTFRLRNPRPRRRDFLIVRIPISFRYSLCFPRSRNPRR